MSVLKFLNENGKWEIINTASPLQEVSNMLKVEFTNTEEDFNLLKAAIDSLPSQGGTIFLSGNGKITYTDDDYITIPNGKEVALSCYGATLNFDYQGAMYVGYTFCVNLDSGASLIIDGGNLNTPTIYTSYSSKCELRGASVAGMHYESADYSSLIMDSCTLNGYSLTLFGGAIFNIMSSRLNSGNLNMSGYGIEASNISGFVHNNVINNCAMSGGIVSFDNNIVTGNITLGGHDGVGCRYFLRNSHFEPNAGLVISDHTDDCEIYLVNLTGIDTAQFENISGVIIK